MAPEGREALRGALPHFAAAAADEAVYLARRLSSAQCPKPYRFGEGRLVVTAQCDECGVSRKALYPGRGLVAPRPRKPPKVRRERRWPLYVVLLVSVAFGIWMGLALILARASGELSLDCIRRMFPQTRDRRS